MEVLAVMEGERDTWMTPTFKYLTDGKLLAEIRKARAVRRKSWWFAIINRTLYKKLFLGPWLRCIGPLQVNYVLREIHEGSCSMHAGNQIKKVLWDNIVCRFGLPEEIISNNGKQSRDDPFKDWCEKV
nr:reverse transcriptase domain-containing protein [Tanacetum cinerariifolium]